MWDWKTASRPYDAWEYQRYAVQPTVYCTAFNLKRFRYGIMVLDGSAQIIDVERDDSHTAFLIELLLGVSRLIEKRVKPWPLNPSGWWCAKRWCPAYATCRGAHIDDGASR